MVTDVSILPALPSEACMGASGGRKLLFALALLRPTRSWILRAAIRFCTQRGRKAAGVIPVSRLNIVPIYAG